MENIDPYILIIICSSTIILSYFYNLYSKKSGIPSVLLLIITGLLIQFGFLLSGEVIEKKDFDVALKFLGIVGLALIVLEAALDLRLIKEKTVVIIKSFSVATIGLIATSYISALFLVLVYSKTGDVKLELVEALLFTVPISILSSAIILPSIEPLDEDRREFMIYESTFSDILGIVLFYSLTRFVGPSSESEIYGVVFGNLTFTILFSVLASYMLIYLFQNIKGHDKLFFLISILLLLFAVGKLFHLSSLIIILIFGVILNNYKLFFSGGLSKLIDEEKVANILSDFKVVTGESAFVVRTFFFILFGVLASVTSMLSFNAIGIGVVLLLIIYLIRTISLFLFYGKNIFPQVFLAPRGLITILLFFAIPEEIINKYGFIYDEFNGVLLFIILASCLIMTWSLIKYKKNIDVANLEDAAEDSDLIDQEIEGAPDMNDQETNSASDSLDQEIDEDTV